MFNPWPPVRPIRSFWRVELWLCIALAALTMPCVADTLVLISGEKLIGKVVSEDDASVVFDSTGLGKLSVPRDRIQQHREGNGSRHSCPGAQEVVAPAVPLGEKVAQTAEPRAPAKKKEDLLRMYWDQGLRYQFYQPITVPVPFTQGERTIGEEVRISGRLGLKASLDAAALPQHAMGSNRFRTEPPFGSSRLYTDGQFGKGSRSYALLTSVRLGQRKLLYVGGLGAMAGRRLCAECAGRI